MADIAAKGMLGQHFVNSYYDQLADVILALGDEKKRGEILRSGDYILPLPPRDATPKPARWATASPRAERGRRQPWPRDDRPDKRPCHAHMDRREIPYETGVQVALRQSPTPLHGKRWWLPENQPDCRVRNERTERLGCEGR